MTDFKTFDLTQALSGRSYPETSVDVYFDEDAAYTAAVLNRERERPGLTLAAAEVLDGRIEEAAKKFKKSKYVFHLKGVPPRVRKAITTETLKILGEGGGTAADAYEAEEIRAAKTWAAHIVRIEDPSGAQKIGLTEEDARDLLGNLPDAAIQAVDEEIGELLERASVGIDVALADTDFSSAVSPEA